MGHRAADVVIVGGSVAGAATAIHLARAGRSVVVADRARFPRDKPCGEGIMPPGVELLAELGVLGRVRAAGARVLTGVRYTLLDGRSAAAAFPDPGDGSARWGLGVVRLALDAILIEEARRAGARVIEQFHARDLCRDGADSWIVSDGDRTVGGRVLVGADGLHSRVRSWLGWDVRWRFPRRWAVVGHYALPPGRDLPSEILVVLARGLEAYLTPLSDGRALVALLGGRDLMRHMRGDLAGGFARIAASLPPLQERLGRATLLPGVRATGPFAARARRVAGAGALLVGDAAGFLDPITGQGIATALAQARAAARTIDQALALPGPPDLSAYAAEHRRLCTTETRLTWLALVLASSGSGFRARRAIRGLQTRPGLFEKLLAINCGQAGLRSLAPRDWAALLLGL